MNSRLRFSSRFLFYTFAASLLVAAPLTTIADEQASPTPAPRPHLSTIEGAFGLKLGDAFTPKKDQRPLDGKNLSAILSIFPANQMPIKEFPIICYEIAAPKPIHALQQYLVFVTPQKHQIYTIVGIGHYFDSQSLEKEYRPLLAALNKKYTGQYSNGADGMAMGDWRERSIYLYRKGSEIDLIYRSGEVLTTGENEWLAEKIKESGIDSDAL